MIKNPYSKLSQFNIVSILTKAFTSYYTVPTKDKNHYYWKIKKYLNQLLVAKKEKRIKTFRKLRIKQEYKNSLNKFLIIFNNNKNYHCKLTKYNLFSFLLIISGKCLENNLQINYQDFLINKDIKINEINQCLFKCLRDSLEYLFLCNNNGIILPLLDKLDIEDKINILKIILVLKKDAYNLSPSDLVSLSN